MSEDVTIEHKPARNPRKDHIGETVFAARWAEFMDTYTEYHDSQLAGILSNCRYPIDARAATVAASLIMWLGTHVGNSFLHDAKRMAEKISSPSDAYLATWALENRRSWPINFGMRALEAIMRSSEDHEKNITQMLSAADYEVAENVVFWLGTETGQNFLRLCGAEIRIHEPYHQDAHLGEEVTQYYFLTGNRRASGRK